ncbi:MAG: Cyclopropane-fatty-acyl-phospholipid synthase [Gemmatimonadetes bacterium]|jgi:cyclopropane-fatty-acyl-phospholipid synthase|nr:Cyclopropane-fatty-acyl-phospholipid synthase [Gemmatimonadota bacterium]
MIQLAHDDMHPGRPPVRPDAAIARTHAVLDVIFGPPARRRFDVHLWDGSVQRGGAADRAPFAIRFQRRGALRRMLLPPSELSIAEALVSGDVDVDGDLEKASVLGDEISARINSVRGVAALLPKLLALPDDDEQPDAEASRYARARRALANRSRRRSSASEIRFHYDVGNEFYALWLDPRMLYTCAYYRHADDDLATAQTAKLEHICRKLRLQPGQRLLDIGCGWGALVQYAAEHYGVQALGITLSAAQAEWAQRSIAERGLSGRCRVEAMDFRDLPADARFDRISSVGVTEHVPADAQEAYFKRAYDALVPGGLFLNHCETSNLAARATNTLGERLERWAWKRDQFIDRYVFPDARLVSLGSLVVKAEKAGFETRDVESLREHYTLTLRAWLRELERRREEAIALVGERTYRVWRLYMSVSARGFDSGAINLAQTLLSRPTAEGASGLPLTREDIYARPVLETVGEPR